MQKGKFGICLWFYALLAFILAFLGQTLLCGLLLGFVILAEKSEWLSKQVIQAFFLTIISSVVSSVLDLLNVFRSIPLIGSAFTVIFNIINSLVSLIILIFCIVAIVRVVKDRDAGLPLLSRLANRACGLLEQKIYTQAPPSAPVYPPQQPTYTTAQPPVNNGGNPPQQ